MKLTVVLGASEEASFDIVLNDNSFVQKWIKELHWCLDNCGFNQREAFAELLCQDQIEIYLDQSCDTINRYLPGFINIHSDFTPQEKYNYLHQCFEKLSGTFDTPTRLFAAANKELRDAIRCLNFFVHVSEKVNKQVPDFYISFDKECYRRHRLDTQDYNYAEYVIEPGTLILHHAELGKDYLDLFEDGLELDYQGFRNLHYYSGEALLSFTGLDVLKKQDYCNWLTDRGTDPYNKTLGHLKIPLGKVLDCTDAMNKINKYQYINKILIKE